MTQVYEHSLKVVRSILQLIIQPCRSFTFDALSPVVVRENRRFFPLQNPERDIKWLQIPLDPHENTCTWTNGWTADFLERERHVLGMTASVAQTVRDKGKRYNIFLHPIQRVDLLYKSCRDYVESLMALFSSESDRTQFLGGENPFTGVWSEEGTWRKRSPEWISSSVEYIMKGDVEQFFVVRDDITFNIFDGNGKS